MNPISAVTLDFFNTLVSHRGPGGRGRALIAYLDEHGFEHGPWEHQVLYDVFDDHDASYSPMGSAAARAEYYRWLADRLFRRLDVVTSNGDSARHAAAIWTILGPESFEVFPDAWVALRALRDRGCSIALVSNWQAGLRHFCTELGLSPYVEHVLGSADLGVSKPDRGIFMEACLRLGAPPARVLHVGDSFVEDYVGGEAAGLQVALLARDRQAPPEAARVIHSLEELPELFAEPRGRGP